MNTVTAIQATPEQVNAICTWVMDLGNTSVWDCAHGVLVHYYAGWAYVVQIAN